MAGWHHRLDGHEFESTPGVGDGQAGLTCCNSWGRKESDTTEQLKCILSSIILSQSPLHLYQSALMCSFYIVVIMLVSISIIEWAPFEGRECHLCESLSSI